MQFLEENKGINLCDLGLWNDFLYMTKKAQVRKEKITDKQKKRSTNEHNNKCARIGNLP